MTIVETDRIPPEVLDESSAPGLVGMKRPFLEAFIRGEIPGITTTLAVAREGERFLACSTFSRFRVAIDCIAPSWVQRWASALRGAWSGFGIIELLMCGLPASLADQETVYAAGLTVEERASARAALVAHSIERLEREPLTACVWKEFDGASESTWRPAFESRGFHRFPSVPVSLQEVTWSSADDYLARLRAPYRRQLLHNTERARAAGLVIETDLEFAPYADEFHPLYLQVLEHSKTLLETLSLTFFRKLATAPRLRYIRATIDGRPVGGALVWVDAPAVLVFLYVGMEYTTMRSCDLYFNLLWAIVRLASAKGVRQVRWGQTSPDAKGRMGATLCPLSFAIRFRSAALHRLVGALGPVLFPAHGQIARRVFKDR